MTSSNASGLTEQEMRICADIDFDPKIASIIKSKTSNEIKQLIGYNLDGNQNPASGIMIAVG